MKNNQLNMQTTDGNLSSSPLQKLNLMDDFLCLIDLHNKVKQIKASEQMEVTYMKMEERDRQIREEGIKERTALLIRKKLAKGKTVEEIAEALEEEVSVVEALIAEMGGI